MYLNNLTYLSNYIYTEIHCLKYTKEMYSNTKCIFYYIIILNISFMYFKYILFKFMLNN